jgi:hypothetical protein
LPSSGADVTKFDAVDVNATVALDEAIVGSQLGPFAAFPLGSTLTRLFDGVQEPTVTHVVRTNTSLEAFVSVVTKLFDIEANATIDPFVFVEGPAVTASGVPFAHIAAVPQIPFIACEPSGARSNMMGSPFVKVGFTANVRMFDVPPPGAALKTCTWSTPPAAMSPCVSWVVTEVELTNVVVRGPPLISITEVALKPVPVTVKVGAVVAAAATLLGATSMITGNGLSIA